MTAESWETVLDIVFVLVLLFCVTRYAQLAHAHRVEMRELDIRYRAAEKESAQTTLHLAEYVRLQAEKELNR